MTRQSICERCGSVRSHDVGLHARLMLDCANCARKTMHAPVRDPDARSAGLAGRAVGPVPATPAYCSPTTTKRSETRPKADRPDPRRRPRDRAPSMSGREGRDERQDVERQQRLYVTRDECIQREIVEPLGEYAADHDIEGIAVEVVETVGTGTQLRFRVAPEPLEFWGVVRRHAVT